jgi:hypothetical protein
MSRKSQATLRESELCALRSAPMKYRSDEWFYGRDELGFQHRAALRTMGIKVEQFHGRPVIGIANSWSELNNCNMNLREVAQPDGHGRGRDAALKPDRWRGPAGKLR